VKWSTVCTDKDKGGLGIKDVTTFNVALLAKWKWRLQNDTTGLWRDIVLSRYGEEGRKSKSSIWWRDLNVVCGENSDNWFVNCTRWVLGNGNKIRFWEDNWTGGGPLMIKYPRLYSITVLKTCTMAESGERGNGEWKWNLKWRRRRFVWETDVEKELMGSITPMISNTEEKDKWIWKEEPDGNYTVRSAYNILRSNGQRSNSNVFKELWEVSALPTALFFTWRAILNRLPIRINLAKRGVMVSSDLCPFCNSLRETESHVLLSCTFSQRVWDMCDNWVGSSNVRANNIEHHFLNFYNFKLNAKQNKKWKSMWVAIMWEIWIHRNKVVFNGGKIDHLEVFGMAQLRAWEWFKYRNKKFSHSYPEWILNPEACIKYSC